MEKINVEKFDLWAIVELFGHQRIAGKCTEQNVAGTNMLRVDVPDTEKQPAFTRLFGYAAIYAINPVDEETARHFVAQLEQTPVQVWDVREMVKKNAQLQIPVAAAAAPESGDMQDDDLLF